MTQIEVRRQSNKTTLKYCSFEGDDTDNRRNQQADHFWKRNILHELSILKNKNMHSKAKFTIYKTLTPLLQKRDVDDKQSR